MPTPRAFLSALALSTLALLALLAPRAGGAQQDEERPPLLVFLVRHAEKQAGGRDPQLTPAGSERAEELARMLRSAELDAVHSSDYRRTRETAAPVAASHGQEVLLYDPRDLAGLAQELKSAGGRHLVVGHSNTTPQLAKLLGGDAGAPIQEASEYDRLYVVSVSPDGAATSALLRFGTSFEEQTATEGD